MNTAPAGSTHSSRLLDTTLVMAVAAILVANSHLESFYPHAWMAGDGLIGNSLFFLLAGYGLVRSERFSQRRFLPWLWRRVVRIHPTLWVVMIVFGLLIESEWRTWPPDQYVKGLLWPTRFTFIQLVFPFYVLFFGLMKLRRAWVYPAAILALVVPYLFFYFADVGRMAPGTPLHLGSRPLPVHVIAYFQVMLLGGWLAWKDVAVPTSRGRFGLLIALGLLYCIVKLAMVEGYGSRAYAILHVLTFALCWSMFEILSATELIVRLKEAPRIWRPIALVGGLTLEIYLVHTFLAEYSWLSGVRSPLNLVAFWVLTILAAILTQRLSNPLRRWMQAGSVRSTGAGRPVPGETKSASSVAENPAS